MKILFGRHGQRGDLAINLPSIEYLHRVNEGRVSIDMPINSRYSDMAPLFLNHPAINSVIITDDYNNFPSQPDKDLLLSKRYSKIFNPMQPHRNDLWWKEDHQVSVNLYDYCDARLNEEEQQINLVKWFKEVRLGGWIAFAPFAGFYSPQNNKKLSLEVAKQIVTKLNSIGYFVLHLGGNDEPDIGAKRFDLNYFESVRHMLGCDLLLHTDTGLGWVASGYKMRQIGLYSNADYGEFTKNIQPKNPNALYLEATNVNEISVDSILKAVQTITQ